MRVLYLYIEVMGYSMATIRKLIDLGVEVHIVYSDRKKLTPFQPESLNNLFFYRLSDFNHSSLKELVDRISPVITVVSGWQEKKYLPITYHLKKNNKIVVSGFDDQWYSTIRQILASFFFKCGILKLFYSHAWVSGSYQFEYARRLGFKKKEIIYDLYSADLELFHDAFTRNINNKNKKYPHRFLFVGRFELVKGIDILLKAWEMLGNEKSDWELVLIGNGSMKPQIFNNKSIIVKDFIHPNELINEISQAGCFVLPSRIEPWGVVIHEFASAGLPLIVSTAVGSASTFLIEGFNGYSFDVGNVNSLMKHLKNIINSSDEILISMGSRSNVLSNRISPITSAQNLLSVLTNGN
jgi:glycosyltransferase involved in cell wall biosynthesis